MDNGRYFEVKRTRGVSTTDFIAKLLDVNKQCRYLASCTETMKNE